MPTILYIIYCILLFILELSNREKHRGSQIRQHVVAFDLTMALRIPSDLLQDFILINDDDIDRDTGELMGHGPVRSDQLPLVYTDSKLKFEYTPRVPKHCAKSISLVCRRWYSFVQQSPRLWISRVNVELMQTSYPWQASQFPHNVLRATDFQECDLDLKIRHHKPSLMHVIADEIHTQLFMEAISSLASQWRSLTINTASSKFWTTFQAACPTLPRLISLTSIVLTPEETCQPITMCMPQVRQLSLEVSTFALETNLPAVLRSTVASLTLNGVSFDTGFENFVTHMHLLATLPHLVQLKIQESHKIAAAPPALISPDWAQPFSSKVLPALKRLHIQGFPTLFRAVLEAFSLEGVEDLMMVRFRNDGHLRPEVHLPALDARSLTNLELNITGSELALLHASTQLPSLSTLKLTVTDLPLGLSELRFDASLPRLKKLSVESVYSIALQRNLGNIDAPMLESVDLKNLVLVSSPDDPIGAATFETTTNIASNYFANLRRVRISHGIFPRGAKPLDVLIGLQAPNLFELDIEGILCGIYIESSWSLTRSYYADILSRPKNVRLRLRERLAFFEEFLGSLAQVEELQITVDHHTLHTEITHLAHIKHSTQLIIPNLSRLTIIIPIARHQLNHAQKVLNVIENMLNSRAMFDAKPVELTVVGIPNDWNGATRFAERSRRHLSADVNWSSVEDL
jgi:hypothetical protein